MSVFMHPIYTQTVGAGGIGTVTFNNIPQGFTDLKIVLSIRGTANQLSSDCFCSFSGQTGTGHSQVRLTGNGTNSSSDNPAPGSAFRAVDLTSATATANTFSTAEIYVSNYSTGNQKPVSTNGAMETNGTLSYSGITAVNYSSSNPITSVRFDSSPGLFAQHSTFTIYGIAANYKGGAPAAPTVGTPVDQGSFVSVPFTPSSNDDSQVYAVTTSPTTQTTYGDKSPIAVPVTIGTSTTFQVAAVNNRGAATSSTSSAITSSNSYTSIGTVTQTSGGGFNAYFTSIPQGYKHLQIRITGRAVTGLGTSPVLLNMNYDSSTSYSWHVLSGDGSSAGSGGLANYANLEGFTIPGAGSTANYFGIHIIDILDYGNLYKFKTIKGIGGYDLNGSGTAQVVSGNWRSTAPITSMLIQAYAGFATNSHIALYGIA